MKKFLPILIFFIISMINQRLYAEIDTLTCTFFMYPKASVDCQIYISYAGNAPSSATFDWNFDGAEILSGSGIGPYIVEWDSVGQKTITLEVIYQGDTCNSSKTIHVVPVPIVYLITGGGSYPYGGSGVHVGLSGSQPNYTYSLYLDGTMTSFYKIGDGNPIDFGLMTAPGTYTCKAKVDSCYCPTDMYGTAVVTVTGYIPPQYICIVTFDTTAQRNKIIWNKIDGEHLAHFNLYRQTYQENVFEKIAEIPYNDFSVYIDILANPSVKAYKYEISVSDSSGNESQKSSYHKTIHLQVSPGINGFNLNWNSYEGFTFHTYRIHRKLAGGDWQLIDSIASDETSYTDLYVTSGLATYYIEVLRYVPCVPSLKQGEYESVVSNPGTSAPIGIGDNSKTGILVFPNPASQKLNILFPDYDHAVYNIELFSLDGRKHLEQYLNSSKTELDITNLSSGIYILKIKGDQSSEVIKIFKE